MQVHALFDPKTYTLTYIVFDDQTRDAVIIDPVLDFDPVNIQTSTESIDQVVRFVSRHDLKVRWILETHAHADHLSGAQELKTRYGAGVVIGELITAIQQTFKGLLDLDEAFPADGRQFDHLISDGETLMAGSLSIKAIHTPGHTPACMSYLIGDALFTGDALFMPDYGTGRCDFPGGSAADLYASVSERIYSLPPETRIFVGHDYQPGGRPLAYETTVGESAAENKQLPGTRSREDYMAFRSARDATLNLPKLIFQSIQVNIRAGHMPEPAPNGMRYFKAPINLRKE